MSRNGEASQIKEILVGMGITMVAVVVAVFLAYYFVFSPKLSKKRLILGNEKKVLRL